LGFEKVEERNEVLGSERGGEDSKMVQLMMQVHERETISYGPERMVRVLMLVFRFGVEFGCRTH
jgi:hypothetical protein